MEYLIELKDVCKDYKSGKVVTHSLKKINLSIKKGEFVSVVGPSGSGKSTLLNILGLLDRPTSGKYFFEGKEISFKRDSELAKIRNKKIGFVFQSFNLLNRYNVYKNVEMPLLYSSKKITNPEERIKKILKEVGLENKIYRKPLELSGGEQQRVAIARALVLDPLLILADEPTGNLDTKNSHKIMEIFRRLNERYNVTIVVVTHEIDIAQYAGRIIYLKDGRIVKEEKK